MNKLTEQNLLKKSRFLKYSLLASISVGAIIAMPFEGMATSIDQQALFRAALDKRLSLSLSQSNGNKDMTNTSQQIGTVIVPGPEINTYTTSEIREMAISNQPKASNPLKDVPVEDHYKVLACSKSDAGKARKVRPITRRKTFVGAEKTEQSQNTYTPEPTEQTPQKPEIIITASSPTVTVSPASNSFVTVPNNTPNITLTSPEHYTKVPGIPSSTPATLYQPTPDSKPNDSVGANTTPNTNSKAARRLSFSISDLQQQTVQSSSQVKPEVSPKPTFVPLPIKKSSTEIAAGMVSNISRVNEMIGIKLAEVTQAIKDTTGKKNKKPLQKLHKQLTSSQKTTEALKSRAEEIETKIKILSDQNKNLADLSKGTRLKSDQERMADKIKICENKDKIKKLEKELTSENNEADRLSEEIDISVNKVVLIKPQVKAPVTEIPPAGSFLNQQQQLEVLTQQQEVNAARQVVVDKKRAGANEVKRNSAEYKDLISEREGVQLEQNQRHIAVEKTKRQRQAEDKQRTEGEKKRKEENHQKEKARAIVETREDIAKKMQQVLSTYSILQVTLNKLPELKVEAIEDKKQRQEAQRQLSEIKKQKKAIKTAIDKVKEVAASAKKETNRTALRAMQDKMNGYSEQLDKIEENLKLLTPVGYNSSTGSTYKQPPEAKPTIPLSYRVQRILGEQPEDEDGYLVPNQAQSQTYMLNQEVADPKSMDSGLGSLSNGTLGKETDEDAGFYLGWENVPHMQTANMNSSLESNPVLGRLQQQIQENRLRVSGQLPSHSKDIYEAQASQYINYLNSIQPNQSNQAQIDGVIDSLATEMRKLSAGQFNQKLDEIAHLINIKAYEDLFLKLYEIQQARVQETQEVYEQAKIFQSYNDKKELEYLDLAGDSFTQKSKQSDTLTIETDKDYVDTYIRVLSNKIQKIEELPGSSSRSEELNHIKEAMAYISNRIQDVEELDEKMLLAINARLQEHDKKISSLLLEKYTGEEAEDILAQLLLQKMLVSDGKSESTLPAGDEEQEDTEVTDVTDVTDVSRQLSSLPAFASSNECALALSDGREKECLALGDGSEDKESYDSGFEEEEETIGQLSDSDGGNLKITEVDTAIPLEQEAKKEMQTQISENSPTLNQAKVVNTIVNNMIRNRLDASINMSNNMVAVGAGDEEESRIKRGLWMRGMCGTNNHERVDNMTGYRGINKGATIGFDAEIDNNIVGIAYSNVHSVFKFKNSKNNDKELIDSHVVSIYGQKELPRNFALQALVSASKNFIKDKTTYSYGDTKIRSNVKHRNHSYNAEALLNYNYLLQNKLVITPNIGLRYGKSRDGVYNETGINVQEITLTMKENNILSGIVGTKVKVPLKDALKFNNLGLIFQGVVEHNFKEKTQRINRVVKIFDNTFKQDYLIPKQPKTSYNLGTGIMGSIKNTTISLDYNYYLNKHYRSHQGSVKLKVNL